MKKYTMEERTQIASALRAAKPRLWDGKRGCIAVSIFICNSIPSSEPGKEIAQAEIMDRLGFDPMRGGAMNNLHSWLIEFAGVPDAEITHERVQAHRHAWLDQLIAEFEAAP